MASTLVLAHAIAWPRWGALYGGAGAGGAATLH
jgi:hypothetical protein